MTVRIQDKQQMSSEPSPQGFSELSQNPEILAQALPAQQGTSNNSANKCRLGKVGNVVGGLIQSTYGAAMTYGGGQMLVPAAMAATATEGSQFTRPAGAMMLTVATGAIDNGLQNFGGGLNRIGDQIKAPRCK